MYAKVKLKTSMSFKLREGAHRAYCFRGAPNNLCAIYRRGKISLKLKMLSSFAQDS